MTREERENAIRCLKLWIEREPQIQTYKICLEALEQELNTWNLDDAREDFMHDVYNTLDFLPTNDEANRIIDSFDRVTSSIKQEPCEDAISRSEALSVFRPRGITEDVWKQCVVYKKLTALPPVKPQQKTGRWIYIGNGHNGLHKCSECGGKRKMFDGLENYCPNCGAKMVEEQESEEV